MDGDSNDFVSGFNTAFCRDGQATATGNFNLGSFRITTLGNATAAADAIRADQIQKQSVVWCGSAGGSADALTLTPSPAISAVATGMSFEFKATASNATTTPTLAISGLTAITIQKSGSTVLAGDITNGRWYRILIDSSTTCQLTPIGAGSLVSIANATNGGLNFSTSGGAVTANIKPGDLATKSSPTAADIVMIGDAAASNVAKTSTVAQLVGGLTASLTNSLSGDVTLNNTGTYFDGPVVAQGSTGTWFASGTVTVVDTVGGSLFNFKLWDGTTVIASCSSVSASATAKLSASLSGVITSPAGNIRISVEDAGSTSGAIKFNASGLSKDSTISVFRIA